MCSGKEAENMKTSSKLVSIAAITFVLAGGGCLADSSTDPTGDPDLTERQSVPDQAGSNRIMDLGPGTAERSRICQALQDNWLNCTNNCEEAWDIYDDYCRH
jgi:hypothetical protein